jgi:hypothetical protein
MDRKKIPNIANLHAEKKTKEEARTKVFTIVLNKCIDKIIETNNFSDKTFTYFEIPDLTMWFPGYNRMSCIHYLLQELKKERYNVEFVHPFTLYIDWSSIKKTKSNPLLSQEMIKTKNPDKLRKQVKELLQKYPNTSKIVYEYEKKPRN